MRLYCVVGKCRNKPAPGFWLCARCAKTRGNCPVDGEYVPSPAMIYVRRRVRY